MLRLVVLALVACGSDDPHSAGSCDQGWVQNGFTSCELACENSGKALGASGASCEARTDDNASVSCSRTFEFDGITGCCSVDGTEVHFAVCQ